MADGMNSGKRSPEGLKDVFDVDEATQYRVATGDYGVVLVAPRSRVDGEAPKGEDLAAKLQELIV